MSDTRSDLPMQGAAGAHPAASEELFAQLYDELHRLAARELRRHAALTLTPTTILHEAYLDISGRSSAVFPDRARFMAYAARAMRGLIIDYARNRCALKRGGAFEITSLTGDVAEQATDVGELERLAGALDALSGLEPRLADVVNLKFFCGFSFAEIAAVQQVSERTVQRDWEKARMLLYDALDE